MQEIETRVEEHTDQGARKVIRFGGGKNQGAADRDGGDVEIKVQKIKSRLDQVAAKCKMRS